MRTKDFVVRAKGADRKVTDTTGAGDSFWGGILSRFCFTGIHPDDLTEDQGLEFLKFANAVAGLCVEKEEPSRLCRVWMRYWHSSRNQKGTRKRYSFVYLRRVPSYKAAAYFMIFSSVASSLVTSPVMTPSCMTIMRSHRDSSSGSSEDTMTIPIPCLAMFLKMA